MRSIDRYGLLGTEPWEHLVYPPEYNTQPNPYINQTLYEIEIFKPSISTNGKVRLSHSQNYKIYADVNKKCKRKVVWRASGWYGNLSGEPIFEFDNDPKGLALTGRAEFYRLRFEAVRFGFYDEKGCSCKAQYTHDVLDNYETENYMQELIESLGGINPGIN